MSKVMFFMVLSVFMFLSGWVSADEVALLKAEVGALKEQVRSLEKIGEERSSKIDILVEQMGLVIAILEEKESNKEEEMRRVEQVEREAQEDKAAVERGMQEIEAWDKQATQDRQGRRWRAGWDYDVCKVSYYRRMCNKGNQNACRKIAHCK